MLRLTNRGANTRSRCIVRFGIVLATVFTLGAADTPAGYPNRAPNLDVLPGFRTPVWSKNQAARE